MKCMKNYILAFVLLFSLVSHAQDNSMMKIPPVDSVFSPKLTGDNFMEKKQYVGNQYYGPDWNAGVVLLESGDSVPVRHLKYNGLFDQLIWLNMYNYKYAIDKNSVREFWLSDDLRMLHFKKLKPWSNQSDSLISIYGEVAFEGKNYALYIQRQITTQWPQYVYEDNKRIQYDVLKLTPVYFIQKPDHAFIRLNKLSNRVVIKAFVKENIDKTKLKTIIKTNHLNLKSEKDFQTLIEQLDVN